MALELLISNYSSYESIYYIKEFLLNIILRHGTELLELQTYDTYYTDYILPSEFDTCLLLIR